MLDSCAESYKNKKNLLAFSAGVDSTALFFLLLDSGIDFDIAIVDYAQRDQSKLEISYAKDLADKYGKKIYATIYDIDVFSEKSARDFRYKFFEKIIQENNYDTLLTAHQLNDQLEWFLMQLGKGAGLIELIGLQNIEQRENYTLIRPLLNCTKDELQEYLEQYDIQYFIDETNSDEKYQRNLIRGQFSDDFLKNYKDGVRQSFNYLHKDYNSFLNGAKLIKKIQDLSIYEYNADTNIAIRVIDQELKQRGILLSTQTRSEILKQKQIIVSHKIAITLEKSKIYIAPVCDAVMSKEFKEKCRVAQIPKNIRSYLFTIKDLINIDEIVK